MSAYCYLVENIRRIEQAFIMVFDNKSQSCIKKDARLPLYVSFCGQVLSMITNKIVS